MSNVNEIGKIIVNKCLNNNIFINTQKLQKLLVLMQIEYIKNNNLPLFLENIEVWDCGVVIKEIDESFRAQGRMFKEKFLDTVLLLNSEEECIDNILNKYGTMSTDELNLLPIIQKIIPWGEVSKENEVPCITAKELKLRI